MHFAHEDKLVSQILQSHAIKPLQKKGAEVM